ncbi:hypothetical protein GS399_03115 [Pedobacter sp. HMF7647]|uniref:Uncharacterized protein n=1 Tax=Hufsiella arboris TaxID=2695275 RepID=A0A7K1Y7B1_9SPHI|nr:hypothetical protein [Hufsiella arboris]MXV49948.1 hypothetical protein [Hufsiella arboris]
MNLKTTLNILFFAIISFEASGQSYMIFEVNKGINLKKISERVSVSENVIELQAADTTLSIFNFYFTTNNFKKTGFDKEGLTKSKSGIDYLQNDVLVSIVPLIKPGETLRIKNLTYKELQKLKAIKPEELLTMAIARLTKSIDDRNYSRPSLKTLEFNLIIKDGNAYHLIEQIPLTTFFVTCSEPWYFPNQFKDGVLNIAEANYLKAYSFSDLKKIINQTYAGYIANELKGRIYLEKIDILKDISSAPVYHYWEYPGAGPWQFSIKNRTISSSHPGLGSFLFLEKIGVVNCTLDFYLNENWKKNFGECCQDSIHFKIKSVNNIELSSFKNLYNATLSKSIRGGE